MKLLFILIVLCTAKICEAQNQDRLPNAHSHNDYSQSDPFFHAYKKGFGSIEADVFLVNKKLFVAHNENEIQKSRTFRELYLNPVKEALKKDSTRALTLLIDIKGDYRLILPELIKELKPLQELIKGYHPDGRLSILISGNRPPPDHFKDYPEYISFDEDLLHTYSKQELKRIGQISLRYSNYSKWKGLDTIPAHEELILKNVIDSVHSLNKPIRFWDAPDNSAGWTELLKLHADMIGTDKIDALSSFLKPDN